MASSDHGSVVNVGQIYSKPVVALTVTNHRLFLELGPSTVISNLAFDLTHECP